MEEEEAGRVRMVRLRGRGAAGRGLRRWLARWRRSGEAGEGEEDRSCGGGGAGEDAGAGEGDERARQLALVMLGRGGRGAGTGALGWRRSREEKAVPPRGGVAGARDRPARRGAGAGARAL